MKSIYPLEFIIGPLGLNLSKEDIASAEHEPDIRKRILILEDFIVKAERDMPRQIAKMLFDDFLLIEPITDELLHQLITRADALRMPHRWNEMRREEYTHAVDGWLSEQTTTNVHPIEVEVGERTYTHIHYIIDHIIHNDSAVGPIMDNYSTNLVDYARGTSWGRDIAKKIDQINGTEGQDEAERSLLRFQRCELENQILTELIDQRISTEDLLSNEEWQALNRRFDSTSAFEILQAAQSLLPRESIIGMAIDFDVCALNTRVYIQCISEMIETLKNRLETGPVIDAEPVTKRSLPVEEFADFLFECLSTSKLLLNTSKADIRFLCFNRNGGTIRFKKSRSDYWYIVIAEKISFVLGRGRFSFSVHNGTKKLDVNGMNLALDRPRKTKLNCRPEVELLLIQIENIDVVMAG